MIVERKQRATHEGWRYSLAREISVVQHVPAGVDAKTVQALLGHTKVETTLRFYAAAPTAAANRKAIEAVNRAG